jgi:FkbM family methyltransferase
MMRRSGRSRAWAAYARTIGPGRVPRSSWRAFRSLRPGDLAIDCGANVGHVTALLAKQGADVVAFEPNPNAFVLLAERFARNPRVDCRPQAASTRAGTARLYLHVDATEDPVKWSVGSSLLGAKPNVDEHSWVDVETIDLDEFVMALGRPVKLLKLDVEGSEIEILDRLISSGRLDEIDHVLVEMHDTRIPGLEQAGADLRKRLAAPRFAHVQLDWD